MLSHLTPMVQFLPAGGLTSHGPGLLSFLMPQSIFCEITTFLKQNLDKLLVLLLNFTKLLI